MKGQAASQVEGLSFLHAQEKVWHLVSETMYLRLKHLLKRRKCQYAQSQNNRLNKQLKLLAHSIFHSATLNWNFEQNSQHWLQLSKVHKAVNKCGLADAVLSIQTPLSPGSSLLDGGRREGWEQWPLQYHPVHWRAPREAHVALMSP